MRVKSCSMAFLLSVVSLVACAPEQKCGGQLYYDPETTNCRRCPTGSTFKNDSCVCNKDQYVFENNMCVLMDGAVVEKEDAGTGAGGGSSCSDYCDFTKACLGDNSLAGILSGVVMGLHGDDHEACTSACKADLSGDGSKDSVVACFADGQAGSKCAETAGQPGIEAAFMLISQCCGGHLDNMLCKSVCGTLKADALVGSRVDFCD